jgi:hypothetical protein
VVTNDAVPEGHKGLHNALYGQEGDAHASSRRYNFREVRGEGLAGLPDADLSDYSPFSLNSVDLGYNLIALKHPWVAN